MTTRRDFLKQGCAICGLVATGGIATLLESCASVPLIKASSVNGTITVPVSSFNGSKNILVRSASLEFDIVVTDKGNGTYCALYLQCTHEAQPLTVSSGAIHCASHGSIFDFEGNVVKEPASRPLKKLPVSVFGQDLLIKTG